MVKLALSFAALAAVVATVASAPLSQSPLMSPFSFNEPNKCIPETNVLEYRPFYLKNVKLNSLVSKKPAYNVLVGGIKGEKSLDELEMCIVSTEFGCSKTIPSNCIFQNVQYRFRVNSPVKGYLKVVNGAVEIVDSFHDASELNLYKEAGWGLRIAQGHNVENRRVFSTTSGGHPLILEEPITNKASQWFEIVASDDVRRGVPSPVIPSPHNKCIPETSIKEYRPFALLSSKLQTLVSRSYRFPYLVGGVSGSKAFQQLEFCIVSTEQACSKTIPSNCIYENVEYRFRVNGPVEGYLRIVGDHLDIVPNFQEGSGLNLYKEAGWGLRVAHLQNGHRTVLATNGGGRALTMEEFKANDARQWFQIVEANPAEIIEEDNAEFAEEIMTEQESCFVPSAPNKCVPETSIKEYHPFALLSSQLQTLVSRPYKFPYLVGGVSGSKAFQQLEFCIVSTEQACSKTIPSNCIYENVEYRFRVNGPVEGYLRIVGDHLDIVPNFQAGSGLNLYKEAGWGLRIAHFQNGRRTVLATNGGGRTLTMEEFKANDARQWFEVIEANNVEKPYRRF